MRCKVHSGSPLVPLGRLRSHDQATAPRNGRNHVDKDCADTPTWRVLTDTRPTGDLQPEPAEPKFGWQHRAASCLEEQFLTTFWPTFTDAQKALLRSQRGPLASAALTVSPTSRATHIKPQPFRLWFVSSPLFLLLPVSSPADVHHLDIYGHHRAACSTAGV